MRLWILAFTVVDVLAVAWLAPLRAQTTTATAAVGPAQRIERFTGTARLGGTEVRVVINNWLIPNRQKIDALELPLRGLTVVELRGGTIVTIIDGQRRQRRAGEFWTVPAGVQMGLETEDDSAAIQTTVVAE